MYYIWEQIPKKMNITNLHEDRLILNKIYYLKRLTHRGRDKVAAILKCIFLNEISIKISLKFVPKGTINNIPSVVQIIAWRRTGGILCVWRLLYVSETTTGKFSAWCVNLL